MSNPVSVVKIRSEADGNMPVNVVEFLKDASLHDYIVDVIEEYSSGNIFGFHVDDTISNPSERVTYLNDAVGMTPAHMDYENDVFDFGSWDNAFFLPRPCMLKFDGTVDYYLNPNDLTKKQDGSVSDVDNINYGGNAMVEWGKSGKKIWYKIIPDADDSGWSCYIADRKVDKDYVAWSFINNQNECVDHFYTPIFNGSLDSNNRLRSISGQRTMISKTGVQEINYAKANNPDGLNVWYIETFADSILINLLLILMGKSTDTQSVFGQGHTSGGSQSIIESELTGSLNNKGMFYGSTDTTIDIKVFFMENYWGHQWRRIAGLMNSNYNYYYKMTYGTADGSSLDSYGTSITGMIDGGATPNSNGYRSKDKVIGKSIILPIEVNGSASTYYCDYDYNSPNETYALRGGASYSGAICGAFSLYLSYGVGNAYWSIGASLSCKPLAR